MPFEFSGEEYKKASVHQKEWGGQIISGLLLNGNENILDLGCGDGVLTAQLAAKVPRGSVLGIDASPSMIKAAAQIYAPNLTFRLKDINDLDFEGEFNLIFSNATLHWVHNHSAFLTSAYRGLKKGGLLRVNFAADGNCSTFIRIVKSAMQIAEYRPYFLNFTWPWYMPALKEYEKLVKELPYREVKVWAENSDRYFPDAESITRWIDQPSLVPFKAMLQPPDREHFRDWVVQKILEAAKQLDGTYFETFRRINVSAVR